MRRVLPLAILLPLLGCSGDDARPVASDDERLGAVAAEDPRGGGGPSDSALVAVPRAGTGARRDESPSPAPRHPASPGAGDSAEADAAGGEQEDAGQSAVDPYAVLDRASEAYGALSSVRADFRQEARNPLLRRTVRSSGTLFQRQPDLFLMRFDDPAGDVIVGDGEHLWVYYPSVDSAQVVRLPAARGAGAADLSSQFIGAPRERFRATFRGTEVVGDRPADVLLLEPRAGDEGYQSLVVWIDRRDGLARRFEINEANGLVRRFELSALRRNPDLPADLFRFEPPEGVRIVDRG